VRVQVIALLVAVSLLIIAVLLPSKQDTSVAGWWTRVCCQLDFFARVALAVACVAGIVWFVVLPLIGWR
jgi:hypothetical protein